MIKGFRFLGISNRPGFVAQWDVVIDQLGEDLESYGKTLREWRAIIAADNANIGTQIDAVGVLQHHQRELGLPINP